MWLSRVFNGGFLGCDGFCWVWGFMYGCSDFGCEASGIGIKDHKLQILVLRIPGLRFDC